MELKLSARAALAMPPRHFRQLAHLLITPNRHPPTTEDLEEFFIKQIDEGCEELKLTGKPTADPHPAQ